MDGLAPMFEVAFLILAINTWLDIRSSLKGSISPFARYHWLKLLLLFTPYVVLLSWSLSSLGITLLNHLKPSLNQLVACSNRKSLSAKALHGFMGSFMIMIDTIQIVFEGLIVYAVWSADSALKKTAGLEGRPRGYKTFLNDHGFSIRLVLLSLVQVGGMSLSIFGVPGTHTTSWSRDPIYVVSSMFALTAFLVFGTTRSMFWVWTGCLRREGGDVGHARSNGVTNGGDSFESVTDV
ncbi:hypothetical protein M422DRAFT_35818 [Sphaerobolus stellatus SS14]|uniref:Uncharacterized protein n=1 Tax=Sphaerobolus stellatus (strain SS14) TaxID=990650 RepID=A0A0C9UT72_SPHS4|nr:hypothetical protein M422DRAFT_35818 [Sphaerobolus stellatus SS14]